MKEWVVGLLSILLCFTACQKEELILLTTDEIETTNFIACHNERTWTEDEMLDALDGRWVLRAVQNPIGGPITDLQESDICIRFISDELIRYSESDSLDVDFAFQLTDNGATSFVLTTEPTESRINGVIYLCDDLLTLVSFNPGGNDYFYQKE